MIRGIVMNMIANRPNNARDAASGGSSTPIASAMPADARMAVSTPAAGRTELINRSFSSLILYVSDTNSAKIVMNAAKITIAELARTDP